ncbi:MAG: YebC/PmpR family DNA-binding transcriptional regulator [Chloroflexota bacterium]|nr:YebC/PmpR family DNA-binding transcriptional regulator [Anaerolineae bacterium]
MSGHSKWSTIKHKKGAADAKRGALFTKLGRELTIAAREGGGDPDTNFRLRLVMDKCRQFNMPKDNIERAIKRGTGELKGAALEEILYEGYGPKGTALLISVLTDSRNRAVAAVRRVLTRSGGSLGATGCVSWLFDRKGYISVEPEENDPEELALLSIDIGAEDVRIESGLVEIFTSVEDFQRIREALHNEALKLVTEEVSWIPKSTTHLSDKETLQNMNLIDELEEIEDVQQVYSNLDVPDDLLAKYEAQAA